MVNFGEESQIQAVYVGPIEKLRGKTALVKPNTVQGANQWSEDIDLGLLAQFDQLYLEYNGVDLSHRWHQFQHEDFTNIGE